MGLTGYPRVQTRNCTWESVTYDKKEFVCDSVCGTVWSFMIWCIRCKMCRYWQIGHFKHILPFIFNQEFFMTWHFSDLLFFRSSDSDGSGHEGLMNPSFTNDNVMFIGRQKDFNTSTPKRASSFKSPIDATTQLWKSCSTKTFRVIFSFSPSDPSLRSLGAHLDLLKVKL